MKKLAETIKAAANSLESINEYEKAAVLDSIYTKMKKKAQDGAFADAAREKIEQQINPAQQQESPVQQQEEMAQAQGTFQFSGEASQQALGILQNMFKEAVQLEGLMVEGVQISELQTIQAIGNKLKTAIIGAIKQISNDGEKEQADIEAME